MRFFQKKKEDVAVKNTNPPESTNVAKGVSSMNATQSVLLAYRTEDDLRSVCRKEIETIAIENWILLSRKIAEVWAVDPTAAGAKNW